MMRRGKTVGTSRKFLAAGFAGLAAMGLVIIGPSGAAAATESCQAGDRDAAKTAGKAGDMHEVETLFIDGSLGHAQVTLRYAEAEDCAWGLLEGTGKIWIEQKSPDGTFNRLYERQLDSP